MVMVRIDEIKEEEMPQGANVRLVERTAKDVAQLHKIMWDEKLASYLDSVKQFWASVAARGTKTVDQIYDPEDGWARAMLEVYR